MHIPYSHLYIHGQSCDQYGVYGSTFLHASGVHMHTQATWGGWHIVADPGSSHYRSADSCLLKLPILTCDTCCREKRIIPSIIPSKTTVDCRFCCLLPSSGATLHTNNCSDVTDSRWGDSTWIYWINKIRAKSQSGACMYVSGEDRRVRGPEKKSKTSSE